MSEKAVIEVEHVSKHYRLTGGTRSLKAVALDLLRRGRRDVKTLKALDDISFKDIRGRLWGLSAPMGPAKAPCFRY
jgi:ABC-type polysaccharide/polyol phosphate transport system ATPase subunit